MPIPCTLYPSVAFQVVRCLYPVPCTLPSPSKSSGAPEDAYTQAPSYTCTCAHTYTYILIRGNGREGDSGRKLRQRELLIEYTRSALGKDVALSYALTVHKAQGSEYPVQSADLL